MTTITTLVNLVTGTLTLIAFILANNNDAIYMGHLFTVYPSDPETNLPYDNRVIALVGIEVVGVLRAAWH